MHRSLARLPHFLLASALAAAALADPVLPAPKQPAPTSPVAIPYPDAPPASSCPLAICLPKLPPAQAARSAPAVLKIGGAEGESSDDKHKGEIEVLSWSWGARLQGGEAIADAERPIPAADTSDPQEGGEIVRNGTGHSMLGASDRKAKTTTRPSIGEINVTKQSDSSSARLLSARTAVKAHEEETIEFPRLKAGEPAPSGTVTIVVARGACVKGQHLPEAILTTRSRSYELHDVEVADCTATAGNTDTCTLTYAALRE